MPNSTELTKVPGIIISSQKYKERGAILNILTPQGIFTVFGSSYKSPKSKYHILNNVFLKITITGKLKKDHIFSIKEFDVQNYNYINNFTLKESETLFKIIKLLKLSNIREAALYEVFSQSLEQIKIAKSKTTYLYYFTFQVLKHSNIQLNFTSCVYCSKEASFKTFSLYEGGLICSNCYKDQTLKNLDYIKKIKILWFGKLEDINLLILPISLTKEIDDLLNESLGIYV